MVDAAAIECGEDLGQRLIWHFPLDFWYLFAFIRVKQLLRNPESPRMTRIDANELSGFWLPINQEL